MRLSDFGTRFASFVSRETTLTRDELWQSWLIDRGVRAFITVPNGTTHDYYFEEGSEDAVLKALTRELQEGWGVRVQRYPNARSRMIEAAQRAGACAGTSGGVEVASVYRAYLQAAYTFCEYIWSAWAVIDHLEPGIAERFPEHLGTIGSLEEPIAFLEMQRDLYRLPIEVVTNRYRWLKMYSMSDEPYTVNDTERLKSESSPRYVEQQLAALTENRKRFQTFVSTIGDSAVRRDVEIVHRYAFLKTDRVEAWKHALALLAPLYQHLAARHSLAFIEAANLSVQETLDALEDEVLLNRESLRVRGVGAALYVLRHGELTVVTDADAVERIRGELEAPVAAVSELRGTAASAGVGRGPAKVIRHSRDLAKVTAGDVLIARYTFPIFTPHMVRCAAIVTDEGGLTGHAAIISREHGIPCVVGVERATRVFRDGDMVEVDADAGTVRRL